VSKARNLSLCVLKPPPPLEYDEGEVRPAVIMGQSAHHYERAFSPSPNELQEHFLQGT
jgi:hypothetical protein